MPPASHAGRVLMFQKHRLRPYTADMHRGPRDGRPVTRPRASGDHRTCFLLLGTCAAENTLGRWRLPPPSALVQGNGTSTSVPCAQALVGGDTGSLVFRWLARPRPGGRTVPSLATVCSGSGGSYKPTSASCFPGNTSQQGSPLRSEICSWTAGERAMRAPGWRQGKPRSRGRQ